MSGWCNDGVQIFTVNAAPTILQMPLGKHEFDISSYRRKLNKSTELSHLMKTRLKEGNVNSKTGRKQWETIPVYL